MTAQDHFPNAPTSVASQHAPGRNDRQTENICVRAISDIFVVSAHQSRHSSSPAAEGGLVFISIPPAPRAEIPVGTAGHNVNVQRLLRDNNKGRFSVARDEKMLKFSGLGHI